MSKIQLIRVIVRIMRILRGGQQTTRTAAVPVSGHASSSYHAQRRNLKSLLLISEKKGQTMGGIFSGRKPSKTAKPFPGQFISLDVRNLQAEQLLEPGQAYNLHQYKQGVKLGIFSVGTHRDYLEIKFTACYQQTYEFTSQFIDIAWTACHFGGHRPWFLCPSDRCGRRIAILYGPQPLYCRQCWRIAYESQRENQVQRLLRRLRSIEASCDQQLSRYGTQTLQRPKGMHHRTFHLLENKHQRMRSHLTRVQVEELIKLEQSLPDWV